MRPKVDGLADSVGADQTAPLGAVISGFALIAQIYLSQYLELLWYTVFKGPFHDV